MDAGPDISAFAFPVRAYYGGSPDALRGYNTTADQYHIGVGSQVEIQFNLRSSSFQFNIIGNTVVITLHVSCAPQPAYHPGDIVYQRLKASWRS